LVTKTTIPSTNQSLEKGKEKPIGRLHYKQYNDTHSTRTINDEKWRIMIPHDIFRYLGFFKKTKSIGSLFHWQH
jgi:hypothetical protein